MPGRTYIVHNDALEPLPYVLIDVKLVGPLAAIIGQLGTEIVGKCLVDMQTSR